MLKLDNVSKSFGESLAIQNISFEIDPGEFVFLTGPSGAGKTTLLRLILREMLPDEGHIYLDGVDITALKHKEVPQLRQQMGVVFQDFKILQYRTLKENIEVALAVVGVGKSEWDSRIEHVLKLVELSGKENLFPKQLSGGEIQRVSLARALVVNPKIILADEPTGNLDWETADKIMDLFEKIKDEGKTVLMATHHQGIIDKLNERIIEIRDGKITKDTGKKTKKTTKTESKQEKAVEKQDKK